MVHNFMKPSPILKKLILQDQDEKFSLCITFKQKI